MPKFNDSENRVMMVSEGDYIFCVVDFGCKISTGAKTRGADQFELEIEIEPKGSMVFETLTDHESCLWKIDTFLKSAGVTLAKGEAYEFREDTAKEKGVCWINPLGLRGWCRVIEDSYTKPGTTNPIKKNKIGTFYTDRPKLPARVIEQELEEDKPF